MPSRGKSITVFAIAGALAALAFLTKPGRRSLRSAKASLHTAQQSLPKLRTAILGNTRGAVAAIFGPPHATVDAPTPKDYWHANTWYYPLDLQRRTAVAIRFSNNIADHVDFIAGPQSLSNRKSA
jgi:outer membrane protein assembly factor BamE (lipoprotein component of BamABCDE complex)